MVPLGDGALAWVVVLAVGLFGCIGLLVVGCGVWNCALAGWFVCLLLLMFLGGKVGCWGVGWFNWCVLLFVCWKLLCFGVDWLLVCGVGTWLVWFVCLMVACWCGVFNS